MVKVGQLGITSSNLRQDADMPLARLDQLSVEQILVMIEQIVQSNKNFWLFEGIEIQASHSQKPWGGGGEGVNRKLYTFGSILY